MKRSRTKSIISWVLSLTMIAIGVALVASFFLAGSLNSTATNSNDAGSFNIPKLDAANGGTPGGPKDKILKLTVPKMSQLENDPRSEEHTSELQSRQYLVCRLLLEKK